MIKELEERVPIIEDHKDKEKLRPIVDMAELRLDNGYRVIEYIVGRYCNALYSADMFRNERRVISLGDIRIRITPLESIIGYTSLVPKIETEEYRVGHETVIG